MFTTIRMPAHELSGATRAMSVFLGALVMGMIIQMVTAALMMLDAEPTAQIVAEKVLAGGNVEVAVGPVVVIISDHWLRAYCIIGAVLGSILSIAVYPPKDMNQKSIIRKSATSLTVSLISGIMFTPVIIRYYDLPRDGDWVLFAAGTVSLLSVSVLSQILPILINSARNKTKDVASTVFGKSYVPDSDIHSDIPRSDPSNHV